MAIVYIVLFGTGVLLAMLIFGGLLGHATRRLLERFGRRGVGTLQAATAAGALLVGVTILGQIF